jgi:hypothetical protein
VARVRNKITGKRQTWVATEAPGKRAPSNLQGTLRKNEHYIGGPGHAEETIANALGNEWEIIYGGTSRNICKGVCAPLFDQLKVTIGGTFFKGARSDKTKFRMFWFR